jgi:hypothetical protein
VIGDGNDNEKGGGVALITTVRLMLERPNPRFQKIEMWMWSNGWDKPTASYVKLQRYVPWYHSPVQLTVGCSEFPGLLQLNVFPRDGLLMP